MEAVVGAAMRAHVFDGRFKTDRGMGGEMPGQVIVHMDSAQLSFCQLLASDALGGRKVVHVSRPPMPRPGPLCVHVVSVLSELVLPVRRRCCPAVAGRRISWCALSGSACACSVVLRGIRGGCSP